MHYELQCQTNKDSYSASYFSNSHKFFDDTFKKVSYVKQMNDVWVLHLHNFSYSNMLFCYTYCIAYPKLFKECKTLLRSSSFVAVESYTVGLALVSSTQNQTMHLSIH